MWPRWMKRIRLSQKKKKEKKEKKTKQHNKGQQQNSALFSLFWKSEAFPYSGDWRRSSSVLVIGRTDAVVGTEVDTLLAGVVDVPVVALTTPATLAASEGVEVTVGKTVAVGVGVLCVGATAMGLILALGPARFIGVGVVVGFMVAVGGTRETGGADVTLMLDGTSATKTQHQTKSV